MNAPDDDWERSFDEVKCRQSGDEEKQSLIFSIRPTTRIRELVIRGDESVAFNPVITAPN
jgi:hypothetical protein